MAKNNPHPRLRNKITIGGYSMNIEAYKGLTPKDQVIVDLLIELSKKVSESNELLQTIIAMADV